MIGSALSYVALRILGEGEEDGDGAIARARKWIVDHGGASSIPSLGKGLSFAEMWCYCRTTYMPMSYLYGKRIQGPITPLVSALQKESTPHLLTILTGINTE
ncbi:putative terpenoid cyclases/protein prenyltransferase alpha-alpha toroid [Helianthus annuus]|nr:putative terpenoid cyclases/protein prenyltransferase alpha-alpha toroid [Helianthus annuus]